MNKQRLPQRIGIIFLLITICATNIASGQQKNNSTTIDNLKTKEAFIVYARGTSYMNGDAESAAGKTSSLIPIKEVKKLGLECVAVNPDIIPYGSVIIGRNKDGQQIIGVAVDTGSAVKSRKAAKSLAKMKGFGEDSPEYKALVLDFHAYKDITRYWDNFTVIPYRGPSFKFDLNRAEKISHIETVKNLYDNRKLLASQ